MTAPGDWCVVYVDTADRPAVVAVLAGLLGAPDARDVFRVPGFTVDVRPNPDRTGGDHYLDWPTTIEIDADAAVPGRSMTSFVTAIVGRLHDTGLRVGTESDPPTDLPPPDTR